MENLYAVTPLTYTTRTWFSRPNFLNRLVHHLLTKASYGTMYTMFLWNFRNFETAVNCCVLENADSDIRPTCLSNLKWSFVKRESQRLWRTSPSNCLTCYTSYRLPKPNIWHRAVYAQYLKVPSSVDFNCQRSFVVVTTKFSQFSMKLTYKTPKLLYCKVQLTTNFSIAASCSGNSIMSFEPVCFLMSLILT